MSDTESQELTDEELNNLSEEERAAILDDDEHEDGDGDDSSDSDDGDAGEGHEDGDGDGDGDDGDGEQAEGDGDGEGSGYGGESDGDGDGEGAESNAEEAGPAAEKDFTPNFKVEVPENMEEQITDIDGKIAALGAKVDDGDLTFSEYNAELATLNNERQELVTLRASANQADSFNEQSEEQRWTKDQNTFFAEESNAHFRGNEILWNALDTAVKQVVADPEFKSISGTDILNEAKVRLNKQLGISDEDDGDSQEDKDKALA